MTGHLSRLIARALPVQARPAAPRPVVDPFESVGAPVPATAPAASDPPGAAPRSIAPTAAPESPSLDRALDRSAVDASPDERPLPILPSALRSDEPVRPAPVAVAPPMAEPRAVDRTVSEHETIVVEHSEHRVVELAPAPATEQRTGIVHTAVTATERVVEREVERAAPLSPLAPSPEPAAIVRVTSTERVVTEPLRASVLPAPTVAPATPEPVETPRLVIGQLLVDVVPTAPPPPPPASRPRAAAPRRTLQPPASGRFGLGQL
jgi:hypothetical protein